MTHFLINRALEEIAAQVEKRVAAERERDEARAELAEIRRIVTETLPDLADQPDRETTVRRVAALATRYQYERDAAALLRKDVDRWEATSQAQAIEEHKLRAEVEWLTGERNAALNQIDRGAFPDWTCAECGSQAGFDEVRYEAGDADMACRTCGGTDVRESAREAAGALGDKYDALKAEVERLRSAPPVVHTTDIEAAVKEWGDWTDWLTAVLRKHTRPLDREVLARAILPAWGDTAATVDAVLRYIGAQAAQPVEPKPPEPAKVRVKLPPRKIPEDYFGIAQLCARAHNDGINACAALLRERGVEVDYE